MASLLPSPLRDRAPATKTPFTALLLAVVAARQPPTLPNSPQLTYRNLCCTWYADYVPALQGVIPASTKTRGHMDCGANRPRSPVPRNGKRPHTIQGTCDDTASWLPRRPADGQQRAALRRGGDGTKSRGLISPSRRTFSTAPEGGLIHLVPTHFPRSLHQLTSVQHVPAGKKDHFEGTKVAVFPSLCARKTSPAAQRTGGHRRVATRKTTGDLATLRGAGDLERAEWTMVLRCGHLRSAPVVVDVSLRTEWEPPTLRAALRGLHARRLGASSMARLRCH